MNPIRALGVLCAIGLVGLCAPSDVAACTCSGRPTDPFFHPCSAYEGAAAIFTGLVTSLTEVPEVSNGKATEFKETVVRLAVEQAFRGVTGPTFELVMPPCCLCGYGFKLGERYLVYAHRDSQGRFTERLCGPTIRLSEASRDLAYIREQLAGDKGLRVYGGAVAGNGDSPRRVPLPGVLVTLEVPGRAAVTVVTDKDGRYEFRDVPAGGYRIRGHAPDGMREWFAPGALRDHTGTIGGEWGRCKSQVLTFAAPSAALEQQIIINENFRLRAPLAARTRQ